MMLRVNATIKDQQASVENAVKGLARDAMAHLAAKVRLAAQSSIMTSEEPSPPGSPPHTREGQLRRAIVFDVGESDAIVGPRASVVGHIGELMEFGGEFFGRDYEARPFMGPALEEAIDDFAGQWSGSLR